MATDLSCPRTVLVTLAAVNTAYQLSALIHAVDSGYSATVLQSEFVAIQYDPDTAAAGSKMRVGNSDLTTSNGMVLISGQSWPPFTIAVPAALINLHNIYIMTTQSGGAVAAVTFLIP
jgi:hypothetical protein